MKYNIILISLIYNNANEILLVKRNREPEIGKWSLSGGIGALEEENDPTKAIAIEVYRDFAVNYINYNFFTMKYASQPEPTLHLYYCGKIKGNLQIKSPKTIQEFKWFTIPDALNIDLAFAETDRDVLQLLKNKFYINK